jgi:hypothetical protein
VRKPLAVHIQEHRHGLKEGLLEESKLANMQLRRIIVQVGTRSRFCRLKVTADTETTRRLLMWHDVPVQSANPVRKFHPFGSP